MSPPATLGSTEQVQEVAGRLSIAVARLHRTLRQHGDSGLPPSQLSVLVAIERHGALTLGELAAHEGGSVPGWRRSDRGLVWVQLDAG